MYSEILEVLNKWLKSTEGLLKLQRRQERLEARLDKLLLEYEEKMATSFSGSNLPAVSGTIRELRKGSIPVDASDR